MEAVKVALLVVAVLMAATLLLMLKMRYDRITSELDGDAWSQRWHERTMEDER